MSTIENLLSFVMNGKSSYDCCRVDELMLESGTLSKTELDLLSFVMNGEFSDDCSRVDVTVLPCLNIKLSLILNVY